MNQVYLLSVVTILLSGIALSFDRLDERIHIGSLFQRDAFTGQTFRLLMAIITAVVGFLQLLTVHPDDTVFLGDLIPAVTGLLLGFVLFLEYYGERTETMSHGMERLHQRLVGNASTIGILGIIVALLHFLLHRMLFL